MGRLTKDPELRHIPITGTAVLNFSIAVNRRFMKDKEQEADFFNIVAWQGTAEFVSKNFSKGQPICIEGRLQQRSWPDPTTGETRYAVEVVAENVHFAGYKRDASQNGDVVYEPDFNPYEENDAA